MVNDPRWKHRNVDSNKPDEVDKALNKLEAEGYEPKFIMGSGANTVVYARRFSESQVEEIARRTREGTGRS